MRRLAYQTRYGYPFGWALLAEAAWRLEHLPLGWLSLHAYRWRKSAEHRGSR